MLIKYNEFVYKEKIATRVSLNDEEIFYFLVCADNSLSESTMKTIVANWPIYKLVGFLFQTKLPRKHPSEGLSISR